MKKKEWYDLLVEYNEQVKVKKFNGILVETECFQNIKEKILQYLTKDALVSATCDAKCLVDSYHREGIAPDCASEIYRKSYPLKWAKRAENIITAVKQEELVKDEDMKNSYYGMRFLDGKLNLWQYMALLAFILLISAIASFLLTLTVS